MKLDLHTILAALPQLAPILPPPLGLAATAAPELIKFGEGVIHSLGEHDQSTIRAAIDDLAAQNDEGHARYQAKLADAAKR